MFSGAIRYSGYIGRYVAASTANCGKKFFSET